ETVVESIWAEPVPPSAFKVLQVHVSQLRKTLGPERIDTRPPGYALRAIPDEIDLARFESLAEAAAEAGDASRRAELLGRALGIWRGPALAEFREEPFARPAARRLAELRLAALEQRADAELELGRPDRPVPDLEAPAGAGPLPSRSGRHRCPRAYRAGRRADPAGRFGAGPRAP